MRKMSVLIGMLFITFMVVPLYGQVDIGLIGGLNIANATIDPDQGVDWESRTVFGVGGVLDYSLSEVMILNVEPMYLQKGTKAEDGDDKVEYKIDYIEVPVMFKYLFGSNDLKPYVMTGPSIGILLNAKTDFTMDGFSDEVDIKDDTKSINFSLGFGAGVSMPMGNKTVFVEARYALGLTNVNDDPEDTETDVKTKDIQIFAGFTFPFGN
ncbi:MAG: PorT family protein [Calditrichaeota bacterium]|nr:MAG: PorT family protein [Calditrichota bacterium]